MREVMREGSVEPRVRLAELPIGRGSVGVGAVEGLDGEITIVDGDVHVTHARGSLPARIADAVNVRATLLTFANPRWSSPRSAEADLDESHLERLAAPVGSFVAIDATGEVIALQLHIARGACPHGVTTPDTQPWLWSAPAGTQARLAGFYAPGRAGTLTHHGTSFHLHAVVTLPDGEIVAGHVDSFRLAPGARVALGTSSAPH